MPPVGLPSNEQHQADFFRRVEEGYQFACARTGEVVRNFRLAGTNVRVRFAGEALVSVLAAGFAHSVASPGEGPLCEICVWDSESTGIPLTPPPRSWEDFTTRGNIWGFDSSRYRSAYHWGEGSVNVMDREAHRAIYWAPSYLRLPPWVISSPLRSILHWWIELNGGQLIHGAAVGYRGRGLLIPGRGGAGKSSTSLACLANGLDFVSDDYLALTWVPEPRVHSLYCTAKVDRRSLDLFPIIAERCRVMDKPGFDKAILFLGDGFQNQFQESLPIERVLMPRVSGKERTTLGPATPVEIERALASGTLMHLPHVSERTVEFLARVSCELPLATIHLGTDRPQIADTIREVLSATVVKDRANDRDVDPRPFVSVVVHFRSEDHAELKAMAASLREQGYPRLELVVTTDAAAGGLRQTAEALEGNIYAHVFDETVLEPVAWNRAIRESFAELLLFLEPGDRLAPGAIEDLVREHRQEPHAGWVAGDVGSGGARRQPLHGVLVRKEAFRRCGLFETNGLLDGALIRNWVDRAAKSGLAGRRFDKVILETTNSSATPPIALAKAALRTLKENADRRRRQAEQP